MIKRESHTALRDYWNLNLNLDIKILVYLNFTVYKSLYMLHLFIGIKLDFKCQICIVFNLTKKKYSFIKNIRLIRKMLHIQLNCVSDSNIWKFRFQRLCLRPLEFLHLIFKIFNKLGINRNCRNFIIYLKIRLECLFIDTFKL